MLGLWMFTAVASATTWTVDPSDSTAVPDIDAAIYSAVSGDRIEIVSGTYVECLDTNGKDLDIEGISGSALTIISGTEDCESTLAIQNGETVSLTGLLLEHPVGRGLYLSGSHGILSDVEVSGSGLDTLDGGGIYISAGSMLAESLLLTGNTADRGGNLLITDGAVVDLVDSRIENGQASRGGGIFVLYGTGGSGAMTIEDCTIEGNQSETDGGGVYLESSANLLSSGSIYTGNEPVHGDGSAIYMGWASTLSSSEDQFTNNGSTTSTGTWGGAIALGSYSSAEITLGEFTGNAAGYGGAISASYENILVLTDCSFVDHEAEVGGALAIEDGSTLDDLGSIYTDNLATTSGGAIWAWDGVSVELEDILFDQNQVEEGDGGALWLGNLIHLSVDSAEFSKNFAMVAGGSVWVDSVFDTVQFTDLSFQGNATDQGEGGALVLVDLSIEGSGLSFAENSAGTEGGAIWASSLDTLALDSTDFESNSAGSGSSGGALWLSFVDTLQIDHSSFCGNQAETGGAVYAYYMHGTESWTGNIFQENEASSDGGAFYIIYSPGHSMTNNTLIGNRAGSSGGSIWATGLSTDFTNNIVAYTQQGDGLYLDDSASDSDSSFQYGNWYDNTSQDASGYATLDVAADGNIAADPDFVDYSLDGDCSNDVLTLLTSSMLIDAGDPSIIDDDGSVSDIGASSVVTEEEKTPDDTGSPDSGDPDTGDSGDGDTGPRDSGEPKDTGKSTADTATGGPHTGDSGPSGPDDSGTVDTGVTDVPDTGSEPNELMPLESDPDCGCAARSSPSGLGWVFLLLVYRRRRKASAGSASSQTQ
jgi:predicted outer membrane repeat protein